MPVNIYNPMIFVTVLLLTFALFLLITGAFTAYFGSGKSRKIGGGLLGFGLAVGIVWGWAAGPGYAATGLPWVNLLAIIPQVILIIVAAVIGAALAIGVFLIAIMKS